MTSVEQYSQSAAQQQMNRKKLSGYVGFANLPNQLHRQSVKRGFHFTLMIVGESGLGKSTLLETLFNARLYPDQSTPIDVSPSDLEFSAFSVDMEESGVRLQLTVVDTPGFGDLINNQDCCQKILDDIERRFDAYMKQEQLIVRPIMPTPLIAAPDAILGTDESDSTETAAPDRSSRNAKVQLFDERVHGCLYFIAPTGHGLKPLDLEFMKQLHQRVNIIPIIAKSDTMTLEEIQLFKRRIMNQLDEAGIVLFRPLLSVSDVDPITLLADSAGQKEDRPSAKRAEEQAGFHDQEWLDECKKLDQAIPFACCGSMNEVDIGAGRRVRGRKYPWGVIEVDNEQHNDFIKLRQLLVRTHMQELKFRTESILYERYRTQKKLGLITGSLSSLAITDNDGQVGSLMKFEEERRQHDLKMKKLEVEMRDVFEQKVAEKEAKMRQNEQELYAKHRESLEQIEKKRQELEERRRILISEGASLVNASTTSFSTKEKSVKTKKGLFK